MRKWNEDQPRDENGRWSGGAGTESAPAGDRVEALRSRVAELEAKPPNFDAPDDGELEEARAALAISQPRDALEARHYAEAEPYERELREERRHLSNRFQAETRAAGERDMAFNDRSRERAREGLQRQRDGFEERLNAESDALFEEHEAERAELDEAREALEDNQDLDDAGYDRRSRDLDDQETSMGARHAREAEDLDDDHEEQRATFGEREDRALERLETVLEAQSTNAPDEAEYERSVQLLERQHERRMRPLLRRQEAEREAYEDTDQPTLPATPPALEIRPLRELVRPRVRKEEAVSETFESRVAIEKIDPEQRIAWGWAYVCEEDGQPVVDVSGDVVDPAEMQKGAHGFVCASRAGGVQHSGLGIGTVVDSIFFSKAVQDALGIDLGRVGWFIGLRVDDPGVWDAVKGGQYPAFSIGGAAVPELLAKWDENQSRGPDGRWDGGGGGGGGGDGEDDEVNRDIDRHEREQAETREDIADIDANDDMTPENVGRELRRVNNQIRLAESGENRFMHASERRELARLRERRTALREAQSQAAGRSTAARDDRAREPAEQSSAAQAVARFREAEAREDRARARSNSPAAQAAARVRAAEARERSPAADAVRRVRQAEIRDREARRERAGRLNQSDAASEREARNFGMPEGRATALREDGERLRERERTERGPLRGRSKKD